MKLETRTFQIREFDDEAREVTGIAVPYDTPTNVGGYSEQFERGAIDGIEGVKLFWNHTEVIGKVIRGEDTDAGYEITARISDTTLGRDTYTYLRDEVIDKFSVGFLPVEQRTEENGVVTRTKVNLKEVSLVPFPAYEGATISQVRSESNSASNSNKEVVSRDTAIVNMTETVNYDDTEIRSELNRFDRELAVLKEGGLSNSAQEPQYRSGGEFLKALAANDPQARAFAATADGAIQPGWVSDDLRLKVENRNIVNLFNKAPLPKTTVVAYKKITGITGTVGAQALEGDALPYMEVVLDDATANVATYGGYISLSRQAIELNPTPVLDVELRHAVNQYAKATNAAVRAALVAGTGYGTGTLAADNATSWIDIVVDSTDYIADNGRGVEAQFLLVSSDVWKRLAHMVDNSGRPLFGISGQAVNAIGSANLTGATLNVGGLTVIKDSGLVANSAFVASSDAVTVWESAGAPFRLADENIITLTKDFSLYGYMAVGVTNANAVVKLDVDLVV